MVHSDLLGLLADPIAKSPLQLDREVLRGLESRVWPIVCGIPRFAGPDDVDQRQTELSFAAKWRRRSSYESTAMREQTARWLCERYGFDAPSSLRDHLAAAGAVLDAGCGSGFSASTWLAPGWAAQGSVWVGVDISTAVDIARERLGSIEHTHFVQADVLALPFADETFDAIFSEGVLHHTPSTERALRALVTVLRRGGELLFYVYRSKAPVREFTDDYVRAIVSELDPDDAWEALRPLTLLGQALAELRVEVDVPDDVPLLGIRAGRHDVQRLIYWHFAKLFWNEKLSLEENNHVQFDWYHPRYAHRHTEEEVRGWCLASGLEITRFDVGESGFTVRAVRT